jgi:hypothetical protein
MFRFHIVVALAAVLENFGKGKALDLPAYQRGFERFDDDSRDELIQTILDEGYLPPVLVRCKEGRYFAEDGQRRLTTLRMFLNGEFALGGRKKRKERGVVYPAVAGRLFKDLTADEQKRFREYSLHVEGYSNASDEEAVRTFRNVNRGSLKLSTGEVMSSQLHNMPLAILARDMLLGILDAYWGKGRTAESKKGSDLVNATATLAGIVHGSSYFNTKEKYLFPVACETLSPEKVLKVRDRVTKLREVWEALPALKSDMFASNWTFTKYNAFILTAIEESDVPWPTQKSYWVQFISECREDKSVHKEMIGGLAGTHATPEWYTRGWTAVFARYA